jgi:hypothetical protein
VTPNFLGLPLLIPDLLNTPTSYPQLFGSGARRPAFASWGLVLFWNLWSLLFFFLVALGLIAHLGLFLPRGLLAASLLIDIAELHQISSSRAFLPLQLRMAS